MYKAVLFDLDHTLLDYDRSEQVSMLRAVTQHGVLDHPEVTWEQFRFVFAPINWKYWSERIERKLGIADVLELSFRDTLQELGMDGAPAAAIANTYWRLFCETSHMLDGAERLLGQLHGSCRLGVISNGIGEAQRERLAAAGIDRYFELLCISDETGYVKPQKEIFDLALARLGLPRQDVLYVGDSIEIDYFGAAGAGIDFCYYNPNRLQLEAHIRPKYTIAQLAELERLLLPGAAAQ